MTTKIYEDEKVIVYLRNDRELVELYVHPKVDGKEQVPRGYMLGSNSLRFEPPKE